MRKSLLILSACAVTAATAVQAAPRQAPPASVLVDKVAMRSDIAMQKYIGHIEAIESVSLQARISGNIQEIKFQEGMIVKKGELLFVIEDTTYRAKAEAARAQVIQAEAEVAYAKHDYERKKNLYAKKAVSELVFDEAVRADKVGQAKLNEAKASLLDAENSLSYTKIYAPITGRISKATYSVGNYVTPSSSALANIVQVSPIYVRFSLSERDYLHMFGSPASMVKNALLEFRQSDGKMYPLPGKVTLIDNQVDDETGTLTVWATVENPDNLLIPGGYVTVQMSCQNSNKKPAIIISGLLTDKKGNYVLVVDKDNKVSRREVKTGLVQNQWQLIDEGLKEGETVIVDGTHKTAPGATVIPSYLNGAK